MFGTAGQIFKKYPLKTALVYGDQKLSFKELNEKANQLAHYLIKMSKIFTKKIFTKKKFRKKVQKKKFRKKIFFSILVKIFSLKIFS